MERRTEEYPGVYQRLFYRRATLSVRLADLCCRGETATIELLWVFEKAEFCCRGESIDRLCCHRTSSGVQTVDLCCRGETVLP